MKIYQKILFSISLVAIFVPWTSQNEIEGNLVNANASHLNDKPAGVFKKNDDTNANSQKSKNIGGFDPISGQPIPFGEELNEKVNFYNLEGFHLIQAFIKGLSGPFPVNIIKGQDAYMCPANSEEENFNMGAFDILFQLLPKTNGKIDGCEGITFCFEGRLDPANEDNVSTPFEVKNLPNNAVAKQCNGQEWEFEWKEGKVILHGFEVTVTKETDSDGKEFLKGQIEFSFSPEIISFNITKPNDQPSGLQPPSFKFKIGNGDFAAASGDGSQSPPLVSSIQVVNFGAKSDGEGQANVVINQTVYEKIWMYMANGGYFAEQSPLVILFPHFTRFSYLRAPKLGVVTSGPSCQMIATITGDQLMACANYTCEGHLDFDEFIYSETESGKDFVEMYKDMVVVNNKEVPVLRTFDGEVEIDDSGRTMISFKEQELVFAVARKRTEKGDFRMVIKRPDGDKDCVSRNIQDNSMVLAINGDPACYVTLSWGERRLYGIDSYNVENYILAASSYYLNFTDDEIMVVDQNNDQMTLVRFPCRFVSQTGRKSIAPSLSQDFTIWRLIINPQHETAVKISKTPKCKLAVGFEKGYNLLIPSHGRK